MNHPLEKCAVVGVHNVPGSAEVTRLALDALNHRGQDATGIATLNNNSQFNRYGGEGLVEDVYDPSVTTADPARVAVGHDRYATSGGAGLVQPTEENDNTLAVAHNGHLSHTTRLEADLYRHGIAPHTNDTKNVSSAIARRVAAGATLEEAAADTYSLIADAGSFCIVAADQSGTMIAMRDPFGFRPLSIGRLAGGFVVASETVALDKVGAEYWGDVEPGQLAIFDKDGPRFRQLAEPNPKLCMTELVYVAHPDTHLLGRRVRDIRYDFGRQLAIEHPAKADMVISVPKTAVPAAMGYAEQSGIPYVEALKIVPGAEKVRSFMGLTLQARRQACAKKLQLQPGSVEGMHVVVVDDSIFRGNVQEQVIQMLRDGGAESVHVRIASPPVRYRNGLGVATPTTTELIAHDRDIGQIRAKINADSLGYISLGGMVTATGQPIERFSLSDFTGENVIEDIHRRSLVSSTT